VAQGKGKRVEGKGLVAESFVFLFFILSLSPLHSQTSDDSLTLKETEKAYVYSASITVEDRIPDSTDTIDELPAFVTVIEIDPESPRFQTVSEVLESAVGVTVQDFGGLGKLSTISIRGASSNQVLVLIDGLRINDASGSGVDLSNLPLENIEKIEVLRGADSAVFGDGAMGGVVNLVTRKSISSGQKLNARIHYGSFDTYSSDLEYFIGRSGLNARLTAYYRASEGDFTFTNNNGTPDTPSDDFEDRRRNNDLKSGGGSGWLKFNGSGQWSITGTMEGFHADKGIPGLITFPSENARQEDKRISTQWRFQKENALMQGSRFNWDVSGMYTGLDFDDPFGEQIGVPVHSRQRTTGYGSRAAYAYTFSAQNGSVSAACRYESLKDEDFEDPDRTTWSFTGKHDAGFFGERIWITAMLRYDDISGVDTELSPKLGIKWFVTPSLAFKANAGSAYRSPSFNELYMNMGYITGNPDLKPEQSVSFDAGLSWEGSRARAEMAVFQMNTEDLIQYMLESGFRYKPYNIGKARSRGVELDLSCRIWKSVKSSAAYTYLEAVDRSDNRNLRDKQIPGRPEHNLFSRLEWDGERFKCFLEWRYVSGNYVTRTNTKELPDRQTGNVGLQYKLTDWLVLGGEIKNFTDDDVVDIRGFPLPPRSWFGSMRIFI